MKLLKPLMISFLVVLLIFVTFRLITAPGPDTGIVAIVIATSLAGTTWDERHRNRCLQRSSQSD